MTHIGWLVAAVCGAAVLYGLHRLARWMERRGWIYYTKARGGVMIGNALQQLQVPFDPALQHTIEVQVEKEREQNDQGDPPDPARHKYVP